MSPASSRELTTLAVLLGKGLALTAAVLLTILAVCLAVPDGNDYAEASVLKHRRLIEAPGRRIVLIGGSNLAFGVDSTIIERKTSCPVVNMGMNGYLGVRFMLKEAEPHLRANDIVIIALEYDSFFKSVDGTAADQLMIVKANPRAFGYLEPHQRWEVAQAIPYVAQQKVLRLIREAKDNALTLLLGREEQVRTVDIENIESLAGFTEHGDLVSHLGVKWPYLLEDGVDMSRTPRDPQVIALLQEFTREMRARGIDVLISYTSVIRDYYARHEGSIEELQRSLEQSSPLVVPSPPSAFVFDEGLFFDTVYHLNAEGRKLRSERLAQDISSYFEGSALCGPSASVVKH